MKHQSTTGEWQMLRDYLDKQEIFPTDVRKLLEPVHKNPAKQTELGRYRDPSEKKCVTADLALIQEMQALYGEIPGFLEAGPRENLAFKAPEPNEGLKVAVVTTGGLAPGLNSVIQTIVGRHRMTYHSLVGTEGGVWGFQNSFGGLVGDRPDWIELKTKEIKEWSEKGGSELGADRFTDLNLEDLSKRIAGNMERWDVSILYVIGGDGSLTAAHEIAKKARKTIVVGIPKTMDNDILWVWQSFGFNSAVERAAAFISTMHCEALSTRRVAGLEFFGARAGFVAANAALASGHVDLVMIPEVFAAMTKDKAKATLNRYKEHLMRAIRRKQKPHAVIVIAEGVGKILAKKGVIKPNDKDRWAKDFTASLDLRTRGNKKVATFSVRPRYYIRAVPANSHDQIYCKRLAALAVDNALAGFTDFMISQWLTEYVLVPLELVAGRQKHVPPNGIFWKQVVSSTGQPKIIY